MPSNESSQATDVQSVGQIERFTPEARRVVRLVGAIHPRRRGSARNAARVLRSRDLAAATRTELSCATAWGTPFPPRGRCDGR